MANLLLGERAREKVGKLWARYFVKREPLLQSRIYSIFDGTGFMMGVIDLIMVRFICKKDMRPVAFIQNNTRLREFALSFN
ncbi:hypothetical protein FOC4_g10001913 [Fusarium odoratissimum]|uniref:Uncharacterized protein n=1 Tax=Fusarium oxysporum f. sp. cubense (strain race 4) TaxID=2502994 RepID=N1S8R8_FUSC4|nr:hypothetical protein FOC4_g10001913 [Fusarium odoratissimum]